MAKFRFKSYENDAGIDSIKNPSGTICLGTQSVNVSLQNYGIQSLTSVNIGWAVNGMVQTSYSWKGTLSSSISTTVTLGSFNFHSGLNTIKAWTSKPNGQTDSLHYIHPNDTAQMNFILTGLPEAGWSVNNILQSYKFLVKDSSFSPSSYVWDFGDGSATSTGYDVSHVFPQNKTYSVKLMVTNTSGCVSEHDSTVNITVSGINPTMNTVLYNLTVFPNPFIDRTTINYTLPETSRVRISIMDIRGNVLFTPSNKSKPPVICILSVV